MPPRYRRLRSTQAIRNFIRETEIRPFDLIQPFFVIEGKNKKETIASMPGIYRFSIDLLLREIESFITLGGQGGIIFGVSKNKDLTGKYAYSLTNPVYLAVKAIKKHFPNFLLITDVCLCAYTTHGHCGIVDGNTIHNDKTLNVLAQIAVTHAQAGADMVAPSDMMDLRIDTIRKALDTHQFQETAILAYAVKYASAFYGPFRDAADCAPSFADRKSYQMDPANSREALKEARQDVTEGADMVMVKPVLAYLDIVSRLREDLNVPIVGYNVSGEYSMIKAASKNGWIDEKNTVLETLTSIKRAGADIIISYHAKDVLQWI